MRFPFRAISISFSGLLLLAACRPAKIQSYRVPKEAPPAPFSLDASASAAGPTIPAASGTDAALRWSAPETWVPLPPVAMRVAGYRLSDAAGTASTELTITAFPGDVGGDLANVNRWRGQIGLAPIGAESLASELKQLRVGEREFKLVEMRNAELAPAQATLAAFTTHEGSTWFFKLTGAPELVSAAKPAFLDFLQTIQAR